jgi:hypothetical protein
MTYKNPNKGGIHVMSNNIKKKSQPCDFVNYQNDITHVNIRIINERTRKRIKI